MFQTLSTDVKMGPILLENKCMLLFLSALLSSFFMLDCYLLLLIQNSAGPPPLRFNSTQRPCTAVSPFCTIDVKSLLLDWMNFYVYNPLSAILYELGHFSTVLSFVSANSISVSHVAVAIVAAKLITHDSLCVRRVGVLLFEFRNFMDALDGTVARARRTESKVLDVNGSKLGYYMDGVCDGLGCIFLLIGCWIYLKNHPTKKNVFYAPLPTTIMSWTDLKEKEVGNGGTVYWARVMLCIRNKIYRSSHLPIWLGVQWFVNSFFWNRYISNFTLALERPSISSSVRTFQGEFLRSPFTSVSFMLWRLLNVHANVELVLFAIFFDKMGDVFALMHFFGWLFLCSAIGCGELLLQEVKYLL